jgi:RNA polymerase sigma-70 factor (ECF subfamily)
MLSLEETEREALRLKFSRAYTNQEIAQMLQLEPSTLGVIVFRALRKLRRILERKNK